MPPVPNVILAQPGSHAALADSDACWSPTRARDRRCARRARSRPPTTPLDGHDRRAAPRHGIAEERRAPARSTHVVRPAESGDGGVRVVGDVRAPRRTASTPATSRRCRSTRRRGPSPSTCARATTPPWSPTGWARAASPCWLRRGCTRRRCAGPAIRVPGPSGSPVRPVPHDGARPLVRDAHRDRRFRRSTDHARSAAGIAAAAMAAGVELDEAGHGTSGGVERASMATMSRRSSTMAARSVVVPTSRTSSDGHSGDFRPGRLEPARLQALTEHAADRLRRRARS